MGKTSCALALAEEMGWIVVELNASDARNYSAIKSIAERGAVFHGFSSDGSFDPARKKLIILDEADSLYERAISDGGQEDFGDSGGKRAIVELLQRTRQPVVLIVNDLYELTKGRGGAIRNLTETIRFRAVHAKTIHTRLREIARAEGVDIDDQTLDTLATRCRGDVRAAINDLQSLSLGAVRVGATDVESVGARDQTVEMRQAIKEIFRGSSAWKVRQTLSSLQETPDNTILWVDENLPLFYRSPEELVAALRFLTRADVFLGRVRRRQYYGLWSYATDLMGVGVFSAHTRNYRDNVSPAFPQYLLRMGQSREQRRVRDSLRGKVRSYSHCSDPQAQELVRDLTQLLQADRQLAVALTERMALEESELIYLVGDEITGRILRDSEQDEVEDSLVSPSASDEESEDTHAKGTSAAPDEPENPTDDSARPAPPGKPDDCSQASLFDFGG